MIRVLFLCNAGYRVPDQVQLARSLPKERFSPFFLRHPATPLSAMEPVRNEGFAVAGPDGEPERASPSSPGSQAPAPQDGIRPIGALRKAKNRLLRSTPAQIALYLGMLRRLKREAARSKRVLDAIRPDLVVANGDRHGSEALFLKTARDRGIPVLIPYFAYSEPQGVRGQRILDPNHLLGRAPSFYYRWAFRKFRAQALDGVLYYLPFEAAAYARIGALPANPWSLGGGPSDVVCVDNLHTLKRYAGYGVEESKLRIVGDANYDLLCEAHARAAAIGSDLDSRYRLDPARKRILVALPQLAEHGFLPWDAHFREIEFLMAALTESGANLLISLHPKMDRGKYAYLESKYGARILQERLYQALPAAHLFVATFSSTVIWAVLCGVPAVVVDFYGLDSHMFDFLKTPAVVKRHEDLAPALAKALAAHADFGPDWENLSRDRIFDGATLARYRDLFAELARKGDR